MQDYDVALKLLLKQSAGRLMHELTGTTIAKWLDVELPKVQNPRADLLGESVEGAIIHLELQSTNDAAMALRMAEYCLGVFRLEVSAAGAALRRRGAAVDAGRTARGRCLVPVPSRRYPRTGWRPASGERGSRG